MHSINKNLFQKELFQEALFVVKKLKDNGFKALFVGGAVRDVLIGKSPDEIDIATDALPEQIDKLFTKVHNVGAKFGVSVVSVSLFNFEIATFRKDIKYFDGRRPDEITYSDITEDSKRRDFTINAMYWDPITSELFDFVDAYKDLQSKRIKAVGEPLLRFNEDRLRILRAVRFSSQLSFDIDIEVIKAINSIQEPLKGVSSERIRDELEKILLSPAPRKAFELMDELQLLERILPQLLALKGVKQPEAYHPEGDVWEHTLQGLDIASKNFPTRTNILMWSILLHDIAKPVTITYPEDENDRIRFNKHDVVGARMVKEILTGLKLPTKTIESVAYIVKDHMRVGIANKMRKGRLKLMMSRDEFKDELALNYVDCMASHCDLSIWKMLSHEYALFIKENMLPDKIVTGTFLIDMGFKPSSLFSEIIEESYIAQLDSVFDSKESALAYVKAHWL